VWEGVYEVEFLFLHPDTCPKLGNNWLSSHLPSQCVFLVVEHQLNVLLLSFLYYFTPKVSG